MKKVIYILLSLTLLALDASAQVDKRDVRRGNRDYRKENYKEAEIEYRKAIVKDSLSVAANYNLAADLYRQNNPQEAQKVLDRIKEGAAVSENAADYFYNLGDVAIANQDWKTAVTAFEESLLRNPGDLDAKENYIYAKKKLEDQQNQDNQNNQNNQNDQNQDQNQDQDQNKNDDQDDQKDQNDDKQDQNQKDQNQNKDQQQNQGQQPKITPQAAQQMLQAIQAKEKETQEKVNKEKAQALKSRQKERNW
jgi:hypothetical protein